MAEILAEHAAATQKQDTISPQAQEMQHLAKLVNELLGRSKKATQDMRSQWPVNYRYVFGGQQWDIRRPRWRFSEVVNITWANIMSEVALQTDSRPAFDYSAVEPSDFKFVEVLKKINEVNWAKSSITGHGWDRKTATQILKSKIYHVVHTEICWDEDMENGLGDVGYKPLDPYGCYWDPLASDIFTARWFIYTEVVPTSKLVREYPEHKDLLKPDITSMGLDGGSKIDMHNIDLIWNSAESGSKATGGRTDVSDNKYGGEPMTLKIRCWLKDETIDELVEEKPLANGEVRKEYIAKKRFPRGRYIEVANNIILKDEENKYEDGLFPIATLVNYDYGEYSGETEVQHQKGPQNIVNYTWSYLLDSMKMGSNPRNIIAQQDADIAKKLTNEPGQNVIVSNPGNFRTEPGAGIPPGMIDIVQLAQSLQDKVQGQTDVSRGTPDPSVTSGLMMDGFVEAAQTRPRLKNRSADEYLRQVGYLCASRYLQYYKQPRSFRITNQEGFPEYVEFSIQDKEDGKRQATVVKTSMDPMTGQLVRGEPEIINVPKGMPDVKVTSGSSLPFARSQKQATALNLYGQKAITLESLLKAVNFPNPEEEAKKVMDEMKAMAPPQ